MYQQLHTNPIPTSAEQEVSISVGYVKGSQTIGSHLTVQNIHLQPLCKGVKVFRALLPYILNSV